MGDEKPYEAPKLTECDPAEALDVLTGLDLDVYASGLSIHRFRTAGCFAETDAVFRERVRTLLPVYEAGRAARKRSRAAGVEECPVLGIDCGDGDGAAVTVVLAGEVIAQFKVDPTGWTDDGFINQVTKYLEIHMRAYAARMRARLPPPLPEPRASFTINQEFEDADPDRLIKKFKADLEEQVMRASAPAPPEGVVTGQRWRHRAAEWGEFSFTLGRRGCAREPTGSDTNWGWEILDSTNSHVFAYDVWWKYHRDQLTLVTDAPAAQAASPLAPVVQPCSACGELPPEGRTHYCPVTLATRFMSDAWLRAHVESRAAETGVKPCCVIGGVYKLRGKVCPFHDPKPEVTPPWVPDDDGFGYRGT